MCVQITNKDLFKRMNETSPILRDEAGFYSNALENVVSALGVPKQVIFQIGKNIGEEMLQKETTSDDFLTDMKNALTGRSNISFHDVMKSVDLESLDASLPFNVENDWGRWSTSILAGIGAGMLTTPMGGFVTGFSVNDALQGKGVVSSFADIA